jgi:hypothetical protein
MADTTTVPVSLEVAARLKQLAAERSRKLGLPRTLSQRDYVEILVNEEEERTQNA